MPPTAFPDIRSKRAVGLQSSYGGASIEFGDQTSYVLFSIATSRPVYSRMRLSSQRMPTKICAVRPQDCTAAPLEPETPAVAISASVVEGGRGRGAVRLPEGSDAGEVFLGIRLNLKEERGWRVDIVVRGM